MSLFRSIGLQNYARIFADPLYWSWPISTRSTSSSPYVVEAVLVGLGMALVLNKLRRAPADADFLLIPWSLSRVVVGLLWVGILDFEFGAFNSVCPTTSA